MSDEASQSAEDQFLDETIERTVAPYLGILPPEVIDQMRFELAMVLLSHPVASRAFARVCPRPFMDQSDTVQKNQGAVEDSDAAEPADGIKRGSSA